MMKNTLCKKALQKALAITLIATLLGSVQHSYGIGIKSGDSSAATSLQSKSAASDAPKALPGKVVKEKKSNSWKWVLGAAVILGLGYIIYDKLIKPKPAPTVEQDYLTNLTFSVYIADKGQVSTYTLENVMTNTNVTIAISDLGVSGVDDKRMGIFGPAGKLEWQATAKNGIATLYVSRNHKADFNFTYTIFLLNHTTIDGKVVNYDLLYEAGQTSKTLLFGPNITYRRGTDAEPGPEEPMTEGPAQLDNALWVGDIKLGSINKVESGGNFMIYYYRLEHARGDRFYENGIYKVRIHPGGTYANKLATIISEIAELCGNFDDLVDGASYPILTDRLTTGNLNEVGKALWRCCFIMYEGKLGATN